MKRRSFLGASAVAAASGIGVLPAREAHSAVKPASATYNGKLAGYTLEELRKLYRYDLFEDYIPFHDKYVVDHDLGGFMVTVDRDGAQISSDKGTWYLGRGIFTYSLLCNKVDNNPKNMEAARKAVEFTLARKPSGEAFWPATFSKDGKPIAPPETRFYGDMFIAIGLAEFSKSPGNEKYWDIAKEIILKCVRVYDRDDYPPETLGKGGPTVNAPRIQGHWMVLINTINTMLEKRYDPEMEALINRALDAEMNKHYNPAYQLNNEVLNHDLSRPDNDYNQYVVTGHSIETMWMVMYEALRRKDKKLFDTAAERFRRHVDVAWDHVYGGAYHTLTHVDNNIWVVGKAQWLQAEILIGSLCIVEHTGAEWAKDLFSKTYTYIRDKWVLKQYGFPLWIDYADRKVTFQRHASRAENFHHPRHLILNLLAIERMIKRGGKVSGVWG
ncbi:MAG: AGE family epimerase/isomerase [Candidatus Latescibacter sp.]|nr:AGE family epimerase/isomerase [Candidatus Latescibacter sp.]